jgi:hypothetical protein
MLSFRLPACPDELTGSFRTGFFAGAATVRYNRATPTEVSAQGHYLQRTLQILTTDLRFSSDLYGGP